MHRQMNNWDDDYMPTRDDKRAEMRFPQVENKMYFQSYVFYNHRQIKEYNIERRGLKN